tara:strand:+ start:66 stop:509 length:444 start_codon:yes stop_codon:yes gene_type:complete
MLIENYKKEITKIFKGKTNKTIFQLIRYTCVGGIAFLFDFGTLFILTYFFSFHYLLSAVIGFTLGLSINYVLSIWWVFSNSTFKNRRVEFLFFTIIGIIGLGLNELSIWSFTDLLHLHYLVSKLYATIIVYLWNFFARKYLLFNKNI